MLQTVQMWKRLKAFQKTLGRYQMSFRKGAIASFLVLALGITACGDGGPSSDPGPRIIKRMSEVSAPLVVQALASMNEVQPSIAITSPRPSSVIDNDDVSVRFRVNGLDLYKDDELGLGPHLNILVDNEFYGAVYDTTTALDLQGLTPGTHTIRAIAVSAWDESFKNPEAYAQTTFHVFTKTPLTAPPDELPLLTYNQPANTYGAEPILLDYFFTPGEAASDPTTQLTEPESNAPIAQAWKVRATVNGEPFVFDQWEPIYLKGFKAGKNWVQVELLDETQQPIESIFNNTARIIQYEPGGGDTLSLLMRDELSVEEVGTLVDPNYVPPSPEVDELEETEVPTEDKAITEESLEAEPETVTDVPELTDSDSGEQEDAAPEVFEFEGTPVDNAQLDESTKVEGAEELDKEETDAIEQGGISPSETDTSGSEELLLEDKDDLAPEDDNESIVEAIAPSESSDLTDSMEAPSADSFDPSEDETFVEESENVTVDSPDLDDTDNSYTPDTLSDEASGLTDPAADGMASSGVEQQEELNLDSPTSALESDSEIDQDQLRGEDEESRSEEILDIFGDV